MEEREGIIAGRIRCGEKRWRIAGVYVNGDMEEKLEGIREWVEERGSGVKTLIGGDFNARTGREGGKINVDGGEEEEGRRSKDGKMNREGRELVSFIKERGRDIMNGGTEGDWVSGRTWGDGAIQ